MRRRWVLALGVLAAAWAQPVAAHADPITAAVVAVVNVIGGATVAAAVGNFLIAYGGILYSTAASWALSKMSAPKGAQSSQERQASVTTLSVGEMPREFIVGTAGTGGSLVDGYYYGGEHGTDWNLLVVALADHVCDGLVGFYVGDTYVAFGGDGDVAGYNGQLKVWWRPGAADDADFPEEISSLGPATAPGNLRGVAKVAVAYKADAPDAESPIWTSGRPAFLWVVRGALCYDPRKDDTVPGGEGPHRWDDPTTREFSDNAELCRYLFSRGVYALDAVDEPAKLRLGRGLSAYEAPPERVFAAANLCDELVDLGEGETERRYRVGGVIRSSETFERVEQMFADAMGGFIIQPEGGVAVSPGEAKTPVASITDDDLVVGEAVRMTPFRSESDRVNTIIPRYVEPTQKWADTSAGVLRDLTDILADGGPLEETLPLVLVPFRAQAERIGEMRRRQHRLERTASITLGPRFAHLEEGDWIEWTSDRHFGGATLVFRITAYGLDAQWRNSLALEETSFYVYGFGAPPTTAEPSTPGLPPGALALSGVTAIPIQLAGEDGSLVPAIRFGWTVPVDPAISRIRAEVRALGAVAVAPTTTDAVSTGTMDATNGVPAAGLVEARLVPTGAAGRAIVPSAWIPITTAGFVSSGVSTIGGLTPTQLVAQLQAASATGQALTQSTLELAMRAIEERGQLISETFHAGVRVKRILIDEDQEWEVGDKTFWARQNMIALLAPNGLSMIMSHDTLMWSETESLAVHVEAIRTQIGTDIASATESIETWVNEESAGAQWIVDLEVAFGLDFLGQITQIASVVSGIGATYTLALNVNGHASGFRLANDGTLSSMVFLADEIGFANSGGSEVYPLAIVGGVVKATNFEADRVKAHSIVADSILGGEITDTALSTSGATYSLSTTHTTVRSLTVNSLGGRLQILSQATIESVSGGDAYCEFRILVDGSNLDDWPKRVVAGDFAREQGISNWTPSAGSHTVELQIALYGGSGVANSVNQLLHITEYKTE